MAGQISKPGDDFCEVLRELRQGNSVDQLTVELRDLVQAVRDTGRRGKLVLTIEVKPASTGDTTVLTLADTVKVTLPTVMALERLI